MRFFVLLLLVSNLVQAQDKAELFFTVETDKRSAENIYPFYDSDENNIKVLVMFDQKLDSTEIKMQWAIQKKGLSSNDIYRDICSPTPYPSGTVTIPINDTFVKSGNYQIVFRLLNKTSKKLTQEALIYIQTFRSPNDYYTEDKQSIEVKRDNSLYSDLDLSKTFVEAYDLKTLKRNINGLFAIASESERKSIRNLQDVNDIKNARRFFFNFWTERNAKNPETPWKAYAVKLNKVAQLFGNGSTAGHQTDRGRIYLSYGAPSFRVTASNEKGALPYEVWFYSTFKQYTNVNLLFVQTGMMRDRMRLLHSSRREFMFNAYWMQELFTDQAEMTNKLGHKVFDYFQ